MATLEIDLSSIIGDYISFTDSGYTITKYIEITPPNIPENSIINSYKFVGSVKSSKYVYIKEFLIADNTVQCTKNYNEFELDLGRDISLTSLECKLTKTISRSINNMRVDFSEPKLIVDYTAPETGGGTGDNNPSSVIKNIHLGNVTIDKLTIGEIQINKVYLGDKLLFDGSGNDSGSGSDNAGYILQNFKPNKTNWSKQFNIDWDTQRLYIDFTLSIPTNRDVTDFSLAAIGPDISSNTKEGIILFNIWFTSSTKYIFEALDKNHTTCGSNMECSVSTNTHYLRFSKENGVEYTSSLDSEYKKNIFMSRSIPTFNYNTLNIGLLQNYTNSIIDTISVRIENI